MSTTGYALASFTLTGLTQNISQTLISPCRASCYNGEAARSSPIALGVS
ncbi:hypothetical protein [Nostoc sp. NOS(2021)]|nr:hypothetical protein [Nostoc sp. NOS(2021)]